MSLWSIKYLSLILRDVKDEFRHVSLAIVMYGEVKREHFARSRDEPVRVYGQQVPFLKMLRKIIIDVFQVALFAAAAAGRRTRT